MKASLKHLMGAGAVAALGTAYVQSAAALTPVDFSAGEKTSNVLRFSGATSTDAAIEELFLLQTNGICKTGSAAVFRGTSQRAVLCTGNNGTVNNAHIAWLKESTAGSENGSRTVASAVTQQLPFLDVFAATFNCAGTAGVGTWNGATQTGTPAPVAAAGVIMAYDQYTNCTGTANSNVRAGISDIEIKFFGSDGGKAARDPIFEVMFGVPVSLNLYRALQAAQGITAKPECNNVANDGEAGTSKLAGPTTGGTQIPNTGIHGAGERDLPECVPSLSRATIAALYNGGIGTWDQLAYGGAALTTFNGGPADAVDGGAVYICRRGDDSGTQRGTQAYFLRQGCGGSDTFISPTPGGGTVTAPITYVDGNAAQVVAGKESGDVRNCLDDRDDTNLWAIGVLSMDSTVTGSVTIRPGAGGGAARLGNMNGPGGDAKDTNGGTDAVPAEAYQREFRFVKVDGYLPSLEVAANGGYEFVTENVCYERTVAPDNITLTSTEDEIYKRICKPGAGATIGLAGRTISLNEVADNQPWGDGAYLIIPKGGATSTPNALPATQAAMETNPVNGWTKQASAFNNCDVTLPFVSGPYPQPAPSGPVGPEDATL